MAQWHRCSSEYMGMGKIGLRRGGGGGSFKPPKRGGGGLGKGLSSQASPKRLVQKPLMMTHQLRRKAA